MEAGFARLATLTQADLDPEGLIEGVLDQLVGLGFNRACWYDVAHDPIRKQDLLIRTAERPERGRGAESVEADPDRLTTHCTVTTANDQPDGPPLRWPASDLGIEGGVRVEIPVTTGVRLDAVIGCDGPTDLAAPDQLDFLRLLGATVGPALALRSAATVQRSRERRRDTSQNPPSELVFGAAEELGSMLDAANVAVFELSWAHSTLTKVHEWTPPRVAPLGKNEVYRVGTSLTGAAWTDERLRHIVHVDAREDGPGLLAEEPASWSRSDGTAGPPETALFAVVGRLDRHFLIRLVNRHKRLGIPFLGEAQTLQALVADLSLEFDAALASRCSQNLLQLGAATAETLGPGEFVDRLAPAMGDEGIDDFVILSRHRDSSQPGFVAARGSRLDDANLRLGERLDDDPLCAASMEGGARVIPVPQVGNDESGRDLSSLLASSGFRSALTMPIRTGRMAGALLVPMTAVPHRSRRLAGLPPKYCSFRTFSALQTYAQMAGGVVEAHSAAVAETGARRVFGLLGHELRGPLASLGSVAERAIVEAQRTVIESDGAPESRLEDLKRLQEELWQRQSDVSKTLELGQLVMAESDGELQLEFRKQRIAKVIEAAVEDVVDEHRRDRISAARYEFEVRPSALRLGALNVDGSLLRHAFKNLLRNAVKYSLPREPSHPMVIDVIGEPQTGYVGVKVRNWGFGIPDDKRDLIFEPWVRGELVDRKKAIRGMGLGLFLTRRAVAAHRGEVRFQSVPTLNDPARNARYEGFETTFEVRLPRELPPGTYVHRW